LFGETSWSKVTYVGYAPSDLSGRTSSLNSFPSLNRQGVEAHVGCTPSSYRSRLCLSGISWAVTVKV